MWPSSTRQINYGLTSEMGMVGVGLRDLFVVAPASSFHQDSSTISFDPLHSINNNSNAGVGLIPLLAATPCLGQPSTGGGGDEDNRAAVANLLRCSGGGGGGGGGGSGGGGGGSEGEIGGGSVCRDCGNQAKKDCSHGRCRTCCKSRGYPCTTHVKSTWVPAARRRERLPTSSSTKKPRLITSQTGTASEHTSNSNTATTPRSFDTSSCHQDASFKGSLPEQVQASAMFKCMRFTSIDDGDDEYAYEAVVKIGGHVFKGVLYDRGIVQPKDGFPNIAELHLGGNNGLGVTRADHM